MRVRLRVRKPVLFGAMLVFALMVFLPMRLVLGGLGLADAGLSAREASGSIWSGRLTEARFGTADLGDLRAALSPVQLIVGRARLNLATPSSDGWRGGVTMSRHSVGVDDLNGTLPGAVLGSAPIGGLSFDGVGIRFADGLCVHAEGRVRAAVTGSFAGLAQGLSGDARCDGAAALLPLASQAGDVRADLRLLADGRYTATLTGGGLTVPIEGMLRRP